MYFLLFLLFTDVNAFYYKDFNFVTHMYNTTNCSKGSYKNISVIHECHNNEIINGYPKCCLDFLHDVNIFHNESFNKCIKTPSLSIKPQSMYYNCHLVSSNKMSFTEIITIIGLIGFLFTSILVVGGLVWIICYFCIDKQKTNYIKL